MRRAKAGAEVAKLLALKAGDPVLVLRRVLEYLGEPVVLDEITLPAALFRGLTKARYDAYRGSMYSFFESQFGVRMLKAQEKLRAVAADAATAEILGTAPGTPLLVRRPRDAHVRRPSGGSAAGAVRDARLSLSERALLTRDVAARRRARRARAVNSVLARDARVWL